MSAMSCLTRKNKRMKSPTENQTQLPISFLQGISNTPVSVEETTQKAISDWSWKGLMTCESCERGANEARVLLDLILNNKEGFVGDDKTSHYEMMEFRIL